MGRAGWDLAALIVLAVVAWAALYLAHRRKLAALNVARYHAAGELKRWGKVSLVGRKEVRVCPDCGTVAHDFRAQEAHAEHHNYVDGLADRVAELERVVAEKLGGGPAEEPAPVPWDGLTGDVVEHAGVVDTGAAGELEARADEPEPEQVVAFRERYRDLIKP